MVGVVVVARARGSVECRMMLFLCPRCAWQFPYSTQPRSRSTASLRGAALPTYRLRRCRYTCAIDTCRYVASMRAPGPTCTLSAPLQAARPATHSPTRCSSTRQTKPLASMRPSPVPLISSTSCAAPAAHVRAPRSQYQYLAWVHAHGMTRQTSMLDGHAGGES
jgi:hypothetical protein